MAGPVIKAIGKRITRKEKILISLDIELSFNKRINGLKKLLIITVVV
jgi:hypothetical protein